MKTAFFSGLTLAFVVMAARAAMDQGRDPEFEKDKIAYIRQYAWPKRTTAGDQEVLFSEKKTGKPATSTTGDKSSPTAKDPSPETPAPPPIESE